MRRHANNCVGLKVGFRGLVLFVDLNGGSWKPDPPDVDDAESAMLAVAAHGIDENDFAEWLQPRVRFDKDK